MITVRTIDNIMRPGDRTIREEPAGGEVQEFAPAEWVGRPALRVIHNGTCLSEEEARGIVPEDGDELIFYLLPGGGFGEAILISIIVSIVLTGVSYAIQALTAPSRRGLEHGQEDSPTYGFDGIVNTVRPGTRIPLIYGKHRFGGHILQQFIRPQRDPPEGEADPQAGELHTLLALGLGPIEGVEEARINKSPWSDYGIPQPEIRLGGMHQAPIHGFHDVVTQQTKDLLVTFVGGAAITTTSGEVDAFELQFRFPGGLYRVGDRGGFRQRSIRIQVEYREVGTFNWSPAKTKTVTSRASSVFDAWFDSGPLDRAQYEIRVTRLTEDDTTATGFSEFKLFAVNEVLDETLTYPGIALAGIRQLPTNRIHGQTPTYDFLVKGRLVRIYTTPTTYTTAYSDNPAWCLHDLLISADALGPWIKEANVDTQSFIDLAAQCTAENLKLNLVVDGSLTAIDTIKQMCVAGRAYFLFRGNKWAVRAAKKESPVQLFTMGRIGRDSFRVLKDSRTKAANYLIGQFANEELDYDNDGLPAEDPTLTGTDDKREQTVNLIGVTSPDQARRLLDHYLISNRLERRLIEMDVGVEAIAMEAADVFAIAHDVPGWGFSGKIRATESGGVILILDRMVTIEAGKTYELTVIHSADQIDVMQVTNTVLESTFRLNVAGEWSQPPTDGLDYSFGENTKSTVLYRCISITSGSAPWRRKVRARQYDERAFDGNIFVLPVPSASHLPDPTKLPTDVTNLRLEERQEYSQGGDLRAAIDVFFSLPIEPGVTAQIYWREQGLSGWETTGVLLNGGYGTITEGIRSPGVTYEVSVASVSALGARRSPDKGVRATITLRGVTRQPGRVANFRADRTVTGVVFEWDALDPVVNYDLDYYEIRHGAQWETGNSIAKTKDTRYESSLILKGTHTFLIKARNTAGNESALAAAVIMVIPGRISENVIVSRDEGPSWTGVKQAFAVSGTELVMDTTTFLIGWRTRPRQNAWGGGRRPGGMGDSFRATAEYVSQAFQITSGDAIRCLVSHILQMTQVDVSAYWTAPGVGDKTWESDFARTRRWAVAPEGKVTFRVEMRFSTTDSNESSFGAWQERAQNIEVSVKWAQARLFVEVLDPAFSVKVQQLTLIFDVPDVIDAGQITTSSSGTVAASFTKTFNQVPKIVAIAISALAGDQVRVTSPTTSGFTLDVVDSLSVRVVRNVNWTAVGF